MLDLYIKPFLLSLVTSFVLTFCVIKIGRKYRLYDKPSKIKIHKKNTVRIGGAAIIISFLIVIFLNSDLVFDDLKYGVAVCSFLILLFGIYDDLKNLSWRSQLFFQAVVASIMIYSGLNVDYIANPLGGAEFRLDGFQYLIFGAHYSILSSLFVLFLIVGIINVVNWLDGLDGLAGGVGFIGSLILFFLSISSTVNQPPLAIISIILSGSVLGFLFYNFHPAKIFMGTSGSMFLGFMLAVMSIFSGAKVATVLLVMGFPILDSIWVVLQRIKGGTSPFAGDTRHLHHKLLELGWSQRKTTLFVYSVCTLFGLAAVVFQGPEKIIALLLLLVLMFTVVFVLQMTKGRNRN